MAVKFKHSDIYTMYYCTFTFYKWMSLFEQTNSYDQVYKWFSTLNENSIDIVAFVIMPNHMHCILNFPDGNFSLNTIIANGKRFMAYEIINRLKKNGEENTLKILKNALTQREKSKGQIHKVFKDSFDAKPIFSEKFLLQKLNYIHFNPVSGKWNLVSDPTEYKHSSASFYETGVTSFFVPKHYKDL